MFTVTLLLLLAVVGSLLVADTVFTLLPGYPDYVTARVALEYVSRELSSLPPGKRGERRRRKLLPKLEEARRRLSRYSLIRLIIVLPLYAATVLASMSSPLPLPLPCCVPLVAHEVGGFCFATGAVFVALAYIAFLPLVQESPLTMLMLKRGWVEAVARRLERW